MPPPESGASVPLVDEADRAFRQRAKAMMRQRFRSQRAGLPAAAVAERSAAICAALLAHPAMAQARAVSLFWPMERRHEVDLRQLDAELRGRGCAVAYPHIDGEGVMTFRITAAASDLAATELGFFAPPASAPEATALDVVVVPGLAFDDRGYRLGYGAGYYDRTLPRYCPPAVPIGVAYDFQLATELPSTDRDVPVVCVVTDRRRLDISPGGAAAS
jgi:5-formyltetrahydrofolate cyclo-ligase